MKELKACMEAKKMTYALDGHMLEGLGLLDAVAVVLVTLIVVGVVLGLGHGELEKREWR